LGVGTQLALDLGHPPLGFVGIKFPGFLLPCDLIQKVLKEGFHRGSP
jgi:hypothetical protein